MVFPWIFTRCPALILLFVGSNLGFSGCVMEMLILIFFHSIMSSRRRHNSLCSIVVDGLLVEGVQPVREAIFNHFTNHFKVTDVERPSIANLNFRTLSMAEGVGLIKPFSLDEVKATVWDCDSFKSLGPDGINFDFIKDFWHELKDEIMRFVSEFHRNDKLSKGINTTFIALIPKVDSPQKLNDFRPISLVGSLYKILAKLLANRLRMVIGSVISETRSEVAGDANEEEEENSGSCSEAAE